MKKPALKLEVWTSTQNQEERHYFIVKKGKGYQQHQYVFGYNPETMEVKKISDDLWELSLKQK